LRHLHGGRIARPARGNLGIGAEVDAAAQERAGGDDDGTRTEATPVSVSTPVI